MKRISLLLASLCLLHSPAFAADAPKKTDPAAKPAAKAPEPQRAPTQANVAYGTHERQVLDFYKA